LNDSLPQSRIKGIDGPIAHRNPHDLGALQLHLHGCLRLSDQVSDGIMATLVHDPKAADIKIIRDFSLCRPGQQFKTGLRPIIGIALELPFLNFLQQAAQGFFPNLNLNFFQTGQDVGASGLIRNHDMAFVADRFRWDMLIGPRILGNGRYMQPPFMRKGRWPDIGRMTVR